MGLAGCATYSPLDKDEIFGKYAVANRTCTGNKLMQAQCNDIKLIEFVRGNFYKIANDEIAFVVWSGEESEELMYSARKYLGEFNISKGESLKAYIEKSNEVDEYIEISFSGDGRYSLEGRSSRGKPSYRMVLDVKRIDSPNGYITNYPAND